MGLAPWWFKLEWRRTKILYYLCAIEFPFTVALLALAGIADPNTYRTDLWTEGGKHGWSSSPSKLLYEFANYRPVSVPAPWNQFITTFNVVIVVLSLFVLLAKVVMYITHVFPPFFSSLVHGALTVLYVYSLSQQAGPDNLDSEHTAKVPWYLTRGCGAPVDPSLQGYCKQQQATFAMVVVLAILFAVHTVVAVVHSIPSKMQKEEHEQEVLENNWMNEKYDYEMDAVPETPGTGMFNPMTPRTVAFNTLDGSLAQKRQSNKNLPLRHHISMGDEVYETQTETFKHDR